jgi:hypothetical protein
MIANSRKRARKLRRRWFEEVGQLLQEKGAVWEDIKLAEYWLRTFSYTEGDRAFWGTHSLHFHPISKEMRVEAEPDQLGMLSIFQCYEIEEE